MPQCSKTWEEDAGLQIQGRREEESPRSSGLRLQEEEEEEDSEIGEEEVRKQREKGNCERGESDGIHHIFRWKRSLASKGKMNRISRVYRTGFDADDEWLSRLKKSPTTVTIYKLC